MSQEAGPQNSKTKIRYSLVISSVVVVAIVVISVWAYHRLRGGPLSEVDGGVEYRIDDLPRGFYKPWDYVSVSIYSGEPHMEGNYILYPIYVSWRLNSSTLTESTVYDFGARDIGGAWYNLTVFDRVGDGRVSDGDYITVTSFNGSIAPGTDYFLKFTTRSQLDGGIAPFYTVLGFRYSGPDLVSWVEIEPNEIAL